MADALGVDDQVRQVAGVGAVRIVEPVLVTQRVVMAAGRGERRAAGADRVDVDPVQPGRQAGDVDVDVDDARAVLDEADPADRLPAGVDERPAGARRAGRGDLASA